MPAAGVPVRLNNRRHEVIATSPIGNRPGGLATGHGSVWLTPHRRNVLLRIDASMPLEAAAIPDVARTIDVGTGTVYLRCSGRGSPTVVLEGNTGEGAPWAVVEARLSRTTRVCVYEPVGIADPAETGRYSARQNITTGRDSARVYARLFPERVRAMMLDGYDDANTPFGDYFVRQAAAFERELEELLSDFAAQLDCGLNVAGNPGATLDRLLADLDQQPLPSDRPGGRPSATASPTRRSARASTQRRNSDG